MRIIKKTLIEIYFLLLIPLRFLGYPEDSLKILQEGERLSKEVGDKRNLANFYSFMGHYYSLRGDLLLAIKYGENCLHEAEKIQDVEFIAPFAFDLSVSYTVRGESLKVVNIVPKVLSLIENSKKESEFFGRPFILYPTFCSSYGLQLGQLGNFKEGEIFCEKGLRIATEMGDLVTLGLIEWLYGYFYILRGDGKLVIEHQQKSFKYYEESQSPHLISFSLAGLGWGYFLIGDYENASKSHEKGITLLNEFGVSIFLSMHHAYLSSALYESGDLKNAQKYAEKALEFSQKNNERIWEAFSKISLGRIIGKTNVSQSTEPEELMLEGIKTLEELKLRPWFSVGYFFLGELYANTGQKEKAKENLKKAESMYQEMDIKYWPNKVKEVLDRL